MIPVNISPLAWDYGTSGPFPHCAWDGFFHPEFARELAAEFPAYESAVLHEYANPLEAKKTCNSWNAFGPATYKALAWLSSPSFVELLRLSIKASFPLYADPGLHGGGLHMHGRGGKLAVHKDYARHPKTGLARCLNLIIYLNDGWQEDWGGHLGLWSAGEDGPGEIQKRILPTMNRAILFATPNAWHGLPEPIACPPGQVRKSLAVYYLTEPDALTETRSRALFAPTPEQANDPQVLELIALRADEATAAQVHRTPISATMRA